MGVDNDDIYIIGNNCVTSNSFNKGIINGRTYNIWDNNNCGVNYRSFTMSDNDWKNPKYNRDYDAFKQFLDGVKRNTDRLKELTDEMQEKLDNKGIFSKKTLVTVCSNWKRFVKGVHRVYKTIIAHIKKWIENA